MEIKEYQEKASRTCANLDSNLEDNLHMAIGVVTEAGEIADVFKKFLAYKKPIDWVNVKEEIGDIMWYIANICNINGWDLKDILQTNINKLKARYPNSFNQHDAINRNI